MIPRKMVIAFVFSYVVLLILSIGSYQYSNYVYRRLCGVIKIQNETFKHLPPNSDTGELMAKEFVKLASKCK